MKVCKECKDLILEENFTKHKYSADGLDYRCKNCKNRILREYRKSHPKWTLEMRRKHYLKSCDNPNILLKRIWNLMQQRCNDPENYQYFRYGGRGIKIQWASLEDFKKDMIVSFKKGLTLERINNDGNYEKANCKWATHVEQSNNTRRNVFYDFDGTKKTLAQIARDKSINYKMLWKRVNVYKLSIDDAIMEALK